MPEDRYIHEMPLVVTPRQAKVLDQRFEAARMIYNAALQEGLKRLRHCGTTCPIYGLDQKEIQRQRRQGNHHRRTI